MKTSYELAMERLSKSAPSTPLTAEQKKQLADLDALYASKVAEREIFLNNQKSKAASEGRWDEVEQLEKQLVSDRTSLKAELEEKKEKVRGKN